MHFSGAAKNSIPPKRKERCNDIPISLYSKKPKKRKIDESKGLQRFFRPEPSSNLSWISVARNRRSSWTNRQNEMGRNNLLRPTSRSEVASRWQVGRVSISYESSRGSQLLLLPSKTALNLSCLATYLLQTLSSHPVGGRVSREGHIWRRWK